MYSLIFLGRFYQISNRFNEILLFTMRFSCTNYAFMAFDLKKRNSFAHKHRYTVQTWS